MVYSTLSDCFELPEAAMSTQETNEEWPILEENDPPLDMTRENAAFERERARLFREHPGWIALIHGDEVVGAYPTYSEARTEGFRRFGLARVICRVITEKDEVGFIPYADLNHPSLRRRG
jgi:hypothetical protein